MEGVIEIRKGTLWQARIPAMPPKSSLSLQEARGWHKARGFLYVRLGEECVIYESTRSVELLARVAGGWVSLEDTGLEGVIVSFCAPTLKPHPSSDSWEAWKAAIPFPDLPF